MVKFLEKCGYIVGNKEGNKDKWFNIIDGILALLYYLVSLVILNMDSISVLSILLNFFIAIRIMLIEVIEYRMKVDNYIFCKKINKNDILVVSKPNIIKIFIGYILILLMSIVFFWCSSPDINMKYLLPFFVLVFTLIKDIINMLERLYDAETNIVIFKRWEKWICR